MTFHVGDRFGVYEIRGPLGAGGMGEVYRAHDSKLGRDVAIKVLPTAFTADAERRARFEREARLLASLNHPNIGAIYGFEDTSDVHALVLELVEGETLAARIARGPLRFPEALAIATAIADALDAAHEKGIVHRDLKPANVMVTPLGTVKVLDFGLAAIDDRRRDLSISPTITDVATREGAVMGTAAYMSPEQARGQAVDKRTDIWAFGCVLFEMVSGQAAFAGPTWSDTLARVLEREPDWPRLPATTPRSFRRLIDRCLTKDPRRRLRDIGDGRTELETISQAPPGVPSTVVGGRRWSAYAGWIVAAGLAALAVGLSFRARVEPVSSGAAVVRTRIDLPDTHRLSTYNRANPLALSPDGRRLVYVGEGDGGPELYVRELDQLEPRRLQGTAGARQPFFSPDGQWIAFFTAGNLQKIAVAGGPPVVICKLPAGSVGGSWGAADRIVFAAVGSELAIVSPVGGTPVTIPGSKDAMWPQILPDGRNVLFILNWRTIATLPIAGGEPRVIARTTGEQNERVAVLGAGDVQAPRVLSNGHLVYGQDPGVVRVADFDLTAVALSGTPVSLADNVERGAGGGAVFFAVSDSGELVYASTGSRHQLVWVDRNGVHAPITADRDRFRIPRISPDGKLVVVPINDETRRSDLWLYDVERGTKDRLTTTGHNLGAAWRPDGTALTFSGGDGVRNTIEEIALRGRRSTAVLRGPTERAEYPSSWSPDGRVLLFQAVPAGGNDIWLFTRDDKVARPLVATTFGESEGHFSPDGKWIAYVSDESGRFEIYAASYPALESRLTISAEGGRHPRWSRDGRELFYRQGDAMMGVAIDTSRGLRASPPRRLFAGAFRGASQDEGFDVAPDGRFVMVKSDEAASLRYLTLVQGWLDDLRNHSPTR